MNVRLCAIGALSGFYALVNLVDFGVILARPHPGRCNDMQHVNRLTVLVAAGALLYMMAVFFRAAQSSAYWASAGMLRVAGILTLFEVAWTLVGLITSVDTCNDHVLAIRHTDMFVVIVQLMIAGFVTYVSYVAVLRARPARL